MQLALREGMPQRFGYILLQRAVHPLIGDHCTLVGQHECGAGAPNPIKRTGWRTTRPATN